MLSIRKVSVQCILGIAQLADGRKLKAEIEISSWGFEMEGNHVVLKEKKKACFVELAGITHIRAMDHYAVLYTCCGKHLLRRSLAEIEDKLYSHGFVRIHRSYIISVSHIKEIEDGWIILDDEGATEIPVGADYEGHLMEAVKKKGYIFL